METLPNAFNFRVMQNYDPETILISSRKLRAAGAVPLPWNFVRALVQWYFGIPATLAARRCYSRDTC